MAEKDTAFEYDDHVLTRGFVQKGDRVRMVVDPVYEASINDDGEEIIVNTPHRRVLVEVISGPSTGEFGWISLACLANRTPEPSDADATDTAAKAHKLPVSTLHEASPQLRS